VFAKGNVVISTVRGNGLVGVGRVDDAERRHGGREE
jgi:hypothetical protein